MTRTMTALSFFLSSFLSFHFNLLLDISVLCRFSLHNIYDTSCFCFLFPTPPPNSKTSKSTPTPHSRCGHGGSVKSTFARVKYLGMHMPPTSRLPDQYS
ncbi:hypothetical protein DFH27DRAFT_582446 [Peziza echinospora]|nr:hypothetical protein DFH27DRAFT_582446 [Peziza echinospora]